ncbi:MAG: TIGR04222 domain-containing membrane protein, partial [Cyanobacteriota bacterium]|nr:TIGR04222 domain-containing membrane protein [Cyanobacteriota bacterium]
MATATSPSVGFAQTERLPQSERLSQSELFARLQAWCLDPPGARLTFSQRLIRETGWTEAFAERVISDYRRFLYLAVVADHPVCPSDAIDQAWHLHLLDTRAYWEEFCPQVLGRPLHHCPSKGLEGEARALREGYRRTLASYEASFGEVPPADLWPSAEQRFGEGPRWRRVDAAHCWILPRLLAPRDGGQHPLAALGAWRRSRLGLFTLLAALALGLSGCGANALTHPFSLNGPQFLLWYGVVTAASLALVKMLHRNLGSNAPAPPADARLSPLEQAFLAGGKGHAVRTALVALLQAGDVNVANGLASLQPKPFRKREALEEAMARALQGGPRNAQAWLREIRKQQPLFTPFEQRLRELGLLNPPGKVALDQWGGALVIGTVWLLGVARLIQGLHAHKPVGFLIVSLGLVSLSWAKEVVAPPRRSRHGDRWIRQLKQHYKVDPPGAEGPELLDAYALLGFAVLPSALANAMEATDLWTRLTPADGVRGWGGNGGGCGSGGSGGGGCGGGCGGG